MCTHEVSFAVDALADAAALMKRGALCVITLKIVRGHSRAACDAQAERQAARLRAALDDVSVLHLMANREKERTVVGFWRGGDAVARGDFPTARAPA